jgi:hypothetical protein
LQRRLDDHSIALGVEIDGRVDDRRFGTVEIADERLEAAFVMEFHHRGFGVTVIDQP